MRRIFNILAILISLTITTPYATYGQNSPSYDDKPPAYIWGTKTISPQKQGSGNKQDGNVQSVGGSIMGWDNENQMWRPISVDATGNLQTSGGSAVDSNPKIMFMKNLSVDAGVVQHYEPFSDNSTSKTYHKDFAICGCTDRIFIEMRSHDIEQEFEIAVKIQDAQVPPAYRKVKGRIMLSLPAECKGHKILLYVHNTSDSILSFTITEGWR